ncbi:hypothetical protein FRX31_014692 [Thalictrum thalictroides]|uniref:Endonuclease/exonuclease/phosphatase n=1 Tax=Thalictrum thalictroides TaxID=46969 RepID=A0A7J6WEE2_THATH|nr:hypothetical protein FRX31_014692 [Thalictrum thalictroides]
MEILKKIDQQYAAGIINVSKLDESDQFLHYHITILSSSLEFILTSVYASNNPSCRLKLWADIVDLRSFVSLPWCVFGDFNNIISSSEKVMGGNSVHPSHIQPFIDCLQEAGLSDLHYIGFHYTWCNNTIGPGRIMSKIDKCLVDSNWLISFTTTNAEFLPHGISDHSPFLVSWHDYQPKARPLRFANYWAQYQDFKSLVEEVWREQIFSDPMNTLNCKLKKQKERLKSWAKHKWHMPSQEGT